jgi:CRP/FNR family transcriptional regulator, cyclic AMP receptor protein
MKNPDHLKAIPLFNLVKRSERQRLAGEVTETRYTKGQFIFREGDPAEFFHIVKEGTVKCVKTSSDGKEVTLKVLMPGDLFCCEAAVFDGSPHPGCAQPMGDVSVLRLRKQAYFEMLKRNPDAAVEVIKYLGTRLHEAQEKTKVLALEGADQRLAGLLVGLVERSSVRFESGYRLTVRLTRQDLANMVGITTETAIRIMGRFKRAQLVTGTAKQLTILDLPRLKHLAAPSMLQTLHS